MVRLLVVDLSAGIARIASDVMHMWPLPPSVDAVSEILPQAQATRVDAARAEESATLEHQEQAAKAEAKSHATVEHQVQAAKA